MLLDTDEDMNGAIDLSRGGGWYFLHGMRTNGEYSIHCSSLVYTGDKRLLPALVETDDRETMRLTPLVSDDRYIKAGYGDGRLLASLLPRLMFLDPQPLHFYGLEE